MVSRETSSVFDAARIPNMSAGEKIIWLASTWPLS